MRLHLAAALTFLAFGSAVPAHAKSPPRIDVLAKCKPNTSCIDVEVNIEDLDARRIGTMKDVCGGPIVTLRARLNGGRAVDYRIGFPGVCLDCGDSWAAYAGQSRAGNPVLLTKAGRLEILDKRIRIGAPDNLVTIDATSGNVIAKYWGNMNGDSYFFIDKKGVYLLGEWACFAAPAAAPRRFTVASRVDKCIQSRYVRQLAKDDADDAPQAPAVAETLKALARDNEHSALDLSFRLRGTNMWVAQFGEPCM